MELAARNKQQDEQYSRNDVLGMLDRGIDDMEAKRELPIEDAFQKITELRDIRRNARV
ncbi:hypothetical protein [Hungatella hathewayi]|uniref:hypothetical protein n=1 Tax=Hungatella hathewayi TaxID=154046 RepID=UPI000AB0D4B3|nr:hypothetical protein [Hungatella hathewayi]